MFFILGMILLPQISNILFYVFHFLIILFKIEYYVFDGLEDRENTIKIIEFINNDNDISKSMVQFSGGKKQSSGICFNKTKGKRFICYIKNDNRVDNGRAKLVQTIYLFGKIPIELVKSNFDVQEEKENTNYINVWDKTNDYRDSYIYKMQIPFKNEPFEDQTKIMNEIISLYNTNDKNIVRTLVWGKPGKGKSFLGKLLAKKLNGGLATFINLTSPGCGFRSLYKISSPKFESPLIIQIDELDVIIKKINNQTVKDKHDWLETACTDKSSYNNFWSEFVTRFPFVIWILTMNSTPEEINALDNCYIRQNRVDFLVEYK